MTRSLGRALGWAALSATFSSTISGTSAWAAESATLAAPAEAAAEPGAAPAEAAAPETPSPPATAPVPPPPPAAAKAPATTAPARSAVPKPSAKQGHVDISGGAARGNVKARDSYDGPPLLLGSNGKVKVGGYAAFGGAYTRFIGRDSGLVSLEGALLLDHRLSLGLVGYGFTRTPNGPDASDGDSREFAGGYGGAALRYSLLGRSPVYASFGVVLGAGAVNLHRDTGWDDEDNWDDGWNRDDEQWDNGDIDAFLFAQPEIALHANLTRWLRVGATAGYRFTGGVRRFGLDESDLNGLVAGGSLAVGWF